MNRTLWIAVLGFLVLPPAASAQVPGLDNADAPPTMTARALASHAQVTPGSRLDVAINATIADKWFYYSPDPGKNELFEPTPAGVVVQAPGLDARKPLWPMDKPHHYQFSDQQFVNNGYEGRFAVFVPVLVPGDAARGRHTISLRLTGQVCGEDLCVPLEGTNTVEAKVEVEVGEAMTPNPQWTADLADKLAQAVPADVLRMRHRPAATQPAEAAPPAPPREIARMTVVGGLSLAFLAGLILNIMPCVLPVVPIRILSIVQLAKESRLRYIVLGLWFAAGIVLFFVVLAGINVALQLAAQRAFDWGRHFQSPPFRIAMAMVIVAMAVNLFGAFTVLVPSGVVRLGERTPRRGREDLASLGMGLMMAILATPCSFAILGTAFAWAQFQPLWLGSLGIITIGLGMAAPHALLTAFPKLVQRLPKPGRWMELTKQSMGFILLLVAVWLIGTLIPGEDKRAVWVAGYGVVLAFCLWMGGSWVDYTHTLTRRVVVRLTATALAAVCGFYMLRAPAPSLIRWQPYDAAQVAAARSAGKPVLIKFTASWCLSCQIVERTTYADPQVARALELRGVVPVKADVTSPDAPANDLLYNHLRTSPPLSILYLPGREEPVRLVGKFDKQELMDALEKAK